MSSHGRDRIAGQLVRLAVPVCGIQLLGMSLLAVDVALCGQLANATQALMAVGCAVQLMYLMSVAILGINVGLTTLLARAYGAADHDRVERLLGQGAALALVVAIMVGTFGAVFARPLMLLIGAPANVAELGAEFLRPFMIALPVHYLLQLCATALRAFGVTRPTFWCAAGAAALNVLLKYLLMFGYLGLPALGVRGASIATVIANLVNLSLLFAVLRRQQMTGKRIRIRLPRREDRGLLWTQIRLGAPAALDMVVMTASYMFVVWLLWAFDDVDVAANGIGNRVHSLATAPAVAFTLATGALVGQSLGSGSVDRARTVTRVSLAICLAIMGSIGLFLIIAARPIAGIFSVPPGSALESQAVLCIRIAGTSLFPAALQPALKGLLLGAGAIRTSLWINVIATLLFQIPIALVLGFGLDLGALGVWLSVPLASAVTAGLGYAAYRRRGWAVPGVDPA